MFVLTIIGRILTVKNWTVFASTHYWEGIASQLTGKLTIDGKRFQSFRITVFVTRPKISAVTLLCVSMYLVTQC